MRRHFERDPPGDGTHPTGVASAEFSSAAPPLRRVEGSGLPMLVGARTRWGVVFCRPSDSLATVLRLLAENQLDWLPVVTGAGKFVGIISLDDIARSIALQEAASPLEPGAAAPSAGGGRA